jgi:hypothetical protein
MHGNGFGGAHRAAIHATDAGVVVGDGGSSLVLRKIPVGARFYAFKTFQAYLPVPIMQKHRHP